MEAKRSIFSHKTSRRSFLKQSAVAVAPLILPTGVLAHAGQPGANDRIVLAHIGLGFRGKFLLAQSRHQARIAAVCDADSSRMEWAAKSLGNGVKTYRDYRDILERRDIDGIVIATPDHWHGLQTVHACQAGKDVYVETPAAKTLAELQAIEQAATRYATQVQVGATGPYTREAHAVRSWLSGQDLQKLQKIACYAAPNPTGGRLRYDGPLPPELDWTLWLGPARYYPYNPDYCHDTFRWMMDFGGGRLSHQGVQLFSTLVHVLQQDAWGRITVSAKGTAPQEGRWDCPQDFEVTYSFSDAPFSFQWMQRSLEAKEAPFGATLHFPDESLQVQRGDARMTTEKKVGNPDSPLPYSPETPMEDWLTGIRTRQKPLLRLRHACYAATLGVLGNLSYRLGRPLEWDGTQQTFINDAQANRLIGNPGGGSWCL